MRKEIEETKQLIDNISAAESNLDSKIERKKAEIERYEKRLRTLMKVRWIIFFVFFVCVVLKCADF